MFLMFVNGEKLIPHFNLVFLLFFLVFLVLGGKIYKMCVKGLIYPSFLTKVGNREVTEGITCG